MIDRIHITSEQMTSFSCPKCQKSKTVNVSQYANLDKIVNKVIVRSIMEDEVGTELAPTEAVVEALGFYLLSQGFKGSGFKVQLNRLNQRETVEKPVQLGGVRSALLSLS